MQSFAEWAEKSLSIGRIMLRVVFGSEVLKNTDQKNEKRLRNWFQNQIRRAVKSGELQPNLDVTLFSSLIIAVLSSTVQEWFISDQDFALRPCLEKRILFLLQSAAIKNQVFRVVGLKRRK